MPESIDAKIHGVDVQLWRLGGAYLRDIETLFVSDTHLGKEATFRRHSIPVPMGSTTATLDKIRAMLLATGARSLVILGDLFHARSSLSPDVCESFDQFFAEHRNLDVSLIRGNHDVGLPTLPETWPVRILPGIQKVGRIALAHHPVDVPDRSVLLFCGHIHPSIRVHAGGDEMRFRCFWLTRNRLVFPAIGKFTGSENVRLSGDDRAWILAGSEIVEWRSS